MEAQEDRDPTYFGYYAMLTHQQNMLQDTVRTSLYHQAILGNAEWLRGKRVMDVGCGSGILSFFAAQAGASRVEAIEAAKAASAKPSMLRTPSLHHVEAKEASAVHVESKLPAVALKHVEKPPVPSTSSAAAAAAPAPPGTTPTSGRSRPP